MPQNYTRAQLLEAVRTDHPQLRNVEDNELFRAIATDHPELAKGISELNQPAYQSPRYPEGPQSRTPGQVASDQAANVLTGIPQAITGIPGALKGMFNLAMSSPYLGGDPEELKANLSSAGTAMAEPFVTIATSRDPDDPRWERAAQAGGAMLAGAELGNIASLTPKLAQAISNRIPHKGSAGMKFQQVMAAAKDTPLDLSQADDIALRALEMGGRGAKTPGTGSSLPKLFADYIRHRESSPAMTYETGRDFALNSGRLSAAEQQAANPVMQRQVALMAKALAESNRKAAQQAGMGSLYAKAMREYRMASRMSDAQALMADLLKQHGAKAAIGAGAGYGAYRALTK